MKWKFDKYQGAGNDFIIVDNLDGKLHFSREQIENLCDRRFGIGGDGFILLEKCEGYAFAMKFFNSDGNSASMCGNGGRCVAKFAYDHKIASEKMTFLADDGVHEAEIVDDATVRLKMVDNGGIAVYDDGYHTNTGVPHFVKFVENVDNVDVDRQGRALADDSRFAPERTNVNFVEFGESSRLRTY
ncbi:MAG: diaminopimelate epimerase, partial [Bacteroidales bacterium]|nr:diaminopimelate epimerase [Bacteroidales bacterium]